MMMLKMLSSWNWRTRVRLSVFVAATLLLLGVGFLCSRFDDDQYRTLMNNIPDDHSNVDTSTTIKMNHPSKGRPSDPPILAYWIFGFRGESKRMLRLLKAVYHPRNQYLLHLLDGDGYEERMELAVSVESEHVFRAFGNVNVVGKSYAVEESGASALSAMLHASALLLRISPLWNWFFTLSSSDYPLFTQDDILFALTSLPRDLNFVGFTNRTIDRNRQHNVNRIVVDPSLHLKQATPLYYAVETREMPTTFDIFQGSPWMVLSRGFMEHCITGWDNFPRKLLMYYANVVSPLESYFHTVLCNSPEFRNRILNQDLRCSAPINVSNYYDNLVNKWAIFARPFKEGDPTLDELDRDILDRQPHGLVRGKWCYNRGHNYSSSCSSNSSTNWDDIDSLHPGIYGQKLQNILSNFTVGDHHMRTEERIFNSHRVMAEVIGAPAAAQVKSIFVYPIKSCRGISVSQAPITSTGFRWDRQWLVVNSKGRAYTQRVEPKLALVEVALPIEAFSEGWEPNNDSYLVIRAPGMDPLKIPLSDPSVVSDGVSVWEWSGSALDEGAEAAMWFSTHLGKPSRLVRFSEVKEMRVVDPNYAQGYNVMFSDGYPYLMLSQGSLNALNSLLKEPVPVNRFRPNVLVDGCEPFAEDLWKEIRINKLTFEGVKLCSRCKVPTINQETAVAGSEPTETLLEFRSDKALRPNKKQQGKVYFGQNMVCSDALSHGKGKIVKVGDPVYVHKVVPSSAEAPA